MFRIALAAFMAMSVSADTPIMLGDAPADSILARGLLKKARVVEPSRHLEQNQQGDKDASFVAGYSIKYLGCSSLIQINQEGQGGGGNADGGVMYTQSLIRFALCPDSCSSCSGGGEYVVDMLSFIDAYTEAKMQEEEWECEQIRESCYCDNANDDQNCENQCYSDAGKDNCVQYEGEENFEIQRYLECQEMENNNGGGGNNNNQGNYYYNGDNGDNYYGSLYIGPYCSTQDSKSIYLGVFYDEGCTAKASLSLYEKKNYGNSLPYSKESIVSTKECLSCIRQDNNNNGGNNGGNGNNNYWNNYNQNGGNNNNGNNNYYYYENQEPSELCEKSYEMAVKCETNMDISYPDTTGCNYINNVLPQLDAASRSVVSGSSASGNAGAALAVIFAFTTILFGAYAYFLYRKIKRGAGGAALMQGEASMS